MSTGFKKYSYRKYTIQSDSEGLWLLIPVKQFCNDEEEYNLLCELCEKKVVNIYNQIFEDGELVILGEIGVIKPDEIDNFFKCAEDEIRSSLEEHYRIRRHIDFINNQNRR